MDVKFKSQGKMQEQHTPKVLIWDLPLRLFHWLLVFAIVAQWVTAEFGYMDWHFKIGYVTLGLVIFRLVWGVVGPRHARFSQFIRPPKDIFNYAKALFSSQNKEYVGHNPLGGLIVPIVIMIVGLQAVTGLFSTDDVLASGPYLSSVSAETQDLLDGLHHDTYNVILGIAGLHIIAIFWYQFKRKIYLIGAMFHGKKALNPENKITSSRWIIALIVAVLIAGFLYWLIVVAAPVPEEEFYF